jgi:hypothetical protein
MRCSIEFPEGSHVALRATGVADRIRVKDDLLQFVPHESDERTGLA